MGKPLFKFLKKGHSLIAVLAIGYSAAAKQPNEPMVTLIDGSWNPGEGGPVTTQPNPLNRPFGVDFDSKGRMWIVELGRAKRLPLAPAHSRTVAMLAAMPTQMVDTSTDRRFIVS